MKKKLSLLQKIEQAGLCGRGGSAYPTAKKWQLTKEFLKKANKGFIVVNAAEGEPGVKKDAYLLEKQTAEVINGIDLAFKFLGQNKIAKIYIYLSADYYQKYHSKLKKVLAAKQYAALDKKVVFFIKPHRLSYICGEETALLNIIEGKRIEPRLRPPFPGEKGLWKKPTLVNNVETFYSVSLIDKNNYNHERLYTLAGALKYRQVFSLPAEYSVEEILRATNNYPDFPFFVMTGGGVCGEILNENQLNAPVEGSGLLMVFDKEKTDLNKLLDYWLKFYEKESCGACTTCREGTYRLRELFENKQVKAAMFQDLLDNLEDSSLCSLGSSLPQTVKSFFDNVYKK